jgi:hypothetical protein
MPDNSEKRVMLLGALLGAVSGALLALFFYRRRQARPGGERRPIKAGEVVRLGGSLALVGRQVLELRA